MSKLDLHLGATSLRLAKESQSKVNGPHKLNEEITHKEISISIFVSSVLVCSRIFVQLYCQVAFFEKGTEGKGKGTGNYQMCIG